ncbi:methylenetetrahydrofolate reductase [NAD(P)H] [Lysobacteraceae bacterium NML95-0200]|nr:methylenetetrahydrofolate reductase [NAD(P)H] [Xanthomonadaceae bacterium NML95-0200]
MLPISFEIYPPKNDAQHAQLQRTLEKLKPYRPQFISCTYGAGGSTREHTAETVQLLSSEHGLEGVPHLTCIGSTREEIIALLAHYQQQGVRRIVALRGDMPSGMLAPGELRHASDLVALIRDAFGQHFHIEVAAYPETHPQARDALADIENFKRKVDAGADSAITQYFYNADAYFRFVDDVRALGVKVPVVPGIMPISNFSQLQRFSESCGAEIPRWVVQRMRAFGDDGSAIREFAADLVASLCQRLLAGGAPALHFYTLNLARPVSNILKRLQ